VYAVVRAAGRQFRVEEGQAIVVPGLDAEPGKQLDLEVLAYADDSGVRVGTPRVEGVTVTAEVAGSRKGRKLDVLRYKSKVRHRKRRGHRQGLVELRVTKISAQ
jgi:large subunit ribosomal protein L21